MSSIKRIPINKIAEEIIKNAVQPSIVQSFSINDNLTIYVFSGIEGHSISIGGKGRGGLVIKEIPFEGNKYPDLAGEKKAISLAKKLRDLLKS